MTLPLSLADQLIETVPLPVVHLLVVLHFNICDQTMLKPPVEINQVRVCIIQERIFGTQPQRDCHPANKRLHKSPVFMCVPGSMKMGHEPSLAPGPLQWWG